MPISAEDRAELARIKAFWETKRAPPAPRLTLLAETLPGVGRTARAHATPIEIPPALAPPEPDCLRCRDAGFVSVPSGVNSRAVRCPSCKGEKIARHQRAQRREEWPVVERLIEEARKEVDPAHPAILALPPAERRRAQAALAEARRAAHDFAWRLPGAIFALEGNYGSGKTLLLAKIYAVAWRRGLAPIYQTGMRFEGRVLDFEGEGPEPMPVTAYLGALIAADVLLIDEADKMKLAPADGWVAKHFFHVIEERLNHERPTVLAGNALSRSLPGAILSRARALESQFIDGLNHVPDARGSVG